MSEMPDTRLLTTIEVLMSSLTVPLNIEIYQHYRQMKTCSTRSKRLDGNLNIFKTVDCSLSEMSVNRKGEKLNFESAPAVSYKSGLEIGEKTCQQGISDLYY